MVIEVGDQDGRQDGLLQRRRQRGAVGRAAGGQTIVIAVVVVPTLELGALVAHGELHGRGVDGQRKLERERVVDGRDVWRWAGGRAGTVRGRVHHRVVLHVRALRVFVADPPVVSAPDEYGLVVGQVAHLDRAHDPPVRRPDDHVLQRHVVRVQPLPEIHVAGSRLREPEVPLQ